MKKSGRNSESSGESESVKELQARFRTWRRSKPHARSPIPQWLWDAAARAARADSVAHVSKVLGLDYKALKKRVCANQSELSATNSQSAFVRLETVPQFSESECVIELQEVSGAKMTIRLGSTGAGILPGLVEAFGRRQR